MFTDTATGPPSSNLAVPSRWFKTRRMPIHRDLEELNVEFNQLAKEAFYLLYARFENRAHELDRRTNENVFQQTLSKYLYTLKTDLEKIAVSILEKNKAIREIDHLKRNLTNRIHDYIQEFTTKSQDL